MNRTAMVADTGYIETGVSLTMVKVGSDGRLDNDKIECNEKVWNKTDINLPRDNDECDATSQD